MSVFEELGPLALASRLKQLSDTLSKEVARVYQEQGIPFEPRWFTLFWALHKQAALTITELATELRQTHAAAVQLSQLLEKKGFLLSHKDKQDERRRRVSLSSRGKDLFQKVEPVLTAIEQANRDLLLSTAPDFLDQLLSLEKALEEQPMFDRIKNKLQLNRQGYSIESYSATYRVALVDFQKRLSRTKPASLPTKDKEWWEQAERVPEHGGMVFLARHNKQIIGSAAILPERQEACRILYLVVEEDYRHKGIGQALLEQMVSFAGSGEFRHLTLRCSPGQEAYLNFFIKNGFLFSSTPASEQDEELFSLRLMRELPGSATFEWTVG